MSLLVDWYAIINSSFDRFTSGTTVKSFPDITYYTHPEAGYSIASQQGLAEYVILYSGRISNIKRYSGVLPYGISFEETNASIVRRLGEPTSMANPSAKHLGIEITYQHFGLTIEFVNKNWEDRENRISTLILFGEDHKDAFNYREVDKFCSVCHRISYSHCGRCRLINYCSRECQILHWKTHKKVCLVV
jgi:hypothetical protein